MIEPLPVRAAYRLWAPQYHTENAVTALEDELVQRLTPDLEGRALLDAGCGTGRRLPPDAALAVGADLVLDMLAAGTRDGRLLINADVCALPLRDRTFDVIWCRLVLGHVRDLVHAYRELARMADHDAHLIVTDFHPAAAAAGHTRGFRDARGVPRVVEHHVHDIAQHRAAAERAGWTLHACCDGRVGPAVRIFYERARLTDRYHRDVGLPLVLALSFRRCPVMP